MTDIDDFIENDVSVLSGSKEVSNNKISPDATITIEDKDPLTTDVEKFIAECKVISDRCKTSHGRCKVISDKGKDTKQNVRKCRGKGENDIDDDSSSDEIIDNSDNDSSANQSEVISDGISDAKSVAITGAKTNHKNKHKGRGNDESVRGATNQNATGNYEPYPNYKQYVAPTGTKLLPTKNISECSMISGKDSTAGESCISNQALQKISDSLGVSNGGSNGSSNGNNDGDNNYSGKTTVQKVIEKMGCSGNPNGEQYCVIEKQQVLSREERAGELQRNFKVRGPTDISLLNNINIDDTLEQWRVKFPKFFHYEFNMVDYEEHGGSLATVNVAELYKGINGQNYDCAGCVINSDKYSGRGKHWMALFLDMRTKPCTAEFFNSSGNPPVAAWVRWMDKCRVQLEGIGLSCEKIRVTDKVHQYSQTECGVYSLLYIWARLNGVSWKYFRDNRVPDQIMFEFRQHLFWDPKNKAMTVWNYDEFKRRTKIKWEDDWSG